MENRCQPLLDELKEAGSEWVLWQQRSLLPPSLTPIDQTPAQSIVLTPELIQRLDENRKKADEAWDRYRAAIDALMDCQKQAANDL